MNILNGNIQEEISGINFSKSNQISVDPKYSKGHYCTLRSTKSVILALPTHVCLLLGIRRDLIRLNEKGEYIWSNDNFYSRMYISTKMKAKARNVDVDLSDVIKEKVGLEEEDVLKRSFFICLSPNDFYSFSIKGITFSIFQRGTDNENFAKRELPNFLTSTFQISQEETKELYKRPNSLQET